MTGFHRLLFLLLCYILTVDVAAAENVTECWIDAGNSYNIGEIFRHPADNCVVCECCEEGIHTCVRRECPTPQCGILKQTNFTEDNCCKKCCQECEEAECPVLTCKYQAYKPDACCKSCGCEYNGIQVPLGPFGHKCDNCVCKENGEVECNRPSCPSVDLKCVNPTYASADNCTWICPTGEYTCRRGKTIIPGGTVVRIKNKICACNPYHWYPRAFCANVQEIFGKRFPDLWYGKCVEKYRGSDIVQNPLMYLSPQWGI